MEKQNFEFLQTCGLKRLVWFLLESISVAIPVLASDLGGISEIVKEEDNNIVIDVVNINELKEKILQYCSNNE